MKAVRIHAHGGPEVIMIEDIPEPEPKADEVLFKVTSSCINYADVQWRLGNGDKTLPTTLGREAAGTITKVGPGVTALKVGQNITARSLGGNAEFAIAQLTNAFVCPDGFDMAQAGGVPIIFLTAYHLLRSLAKVNRGDTVLIQAGASGVGSILLQMCKVWGFKSITTASNEAKLKLCRDLGADETINYTTHDFVTEVMRITNGAGVQLALDAVGGEVTEKSMKCLAPGASLVNYGNASNTAASLPMADFREGRWATGFSLVATFPTWDNPSAMAEVMGLMKDGKIKMIVDHVLPMSEAAKGHAHLSGRGAMGKVILVP
jgi:NADPH2:quinone reductase